MPETAPPQAPTAVPAGKAVPGRRGLTAALALLSLAAAIAVLFATRNGVGISPDAGSYIGAARSLARTGALDLPFGGRAPRPLTHFPPLLPVLLAGGSAMGVDAPTACRWLNACALAGTVFLTGLLVLRRTGCAGLSVFGALFTATSLDLLAVHTAVLSEPVFILLCTLALYALDLYVERPSFGLLAGSATALGLALLTRWTGAPFVGTGLVVIVLLSEQAWGRRARAAIAFGLIACGPTLLWLARSASSGTAANRVIAFHPFHLGHVREAVYTVSRWFLPGAVPLMVRTRLFALLCVVGVGVTAAVLVLHRRREGRGALAERPWRPPYVHLILPVGYMGFLVVSISLLDASTPLDERILAPLVVSAAVLLCWAAGLALRTPVARRTLTVLTVVVCGALLLFTAARALTWTARRSRDGKGYTSAAWTTSDAIGAVGALGPDRPLYTNDAVAVYVITGRPALDLPLMRDPTSLRENAEFDERMAAVARDMRERGAVVAMLTRAKHTLEWLPMPDELQRRLGAEVLALCDDGVLYRAPAEATARKQASEEAR